MDDGIPRYLTVAELARRTGMSSAYWRRAIVRKVIPVVRLGRSVRVAEHHLRAFIEERERPASWSAVR